MAEPTRGEVADFWNKVDAFKAKIPEFARLQRELGDREFVVSRSNDPELQQRYAEVMAEGRRFQTEIQAITSAIDRASVMWDQVRDFFSLDGLGALGFAPLAIGAIVAMVAAGLVSITYLVDNMYTVSKDIDLVELQLAEQQRLEAGGLSPQEAATLARGNVPRRVPTTFESLGSLAMWGALAIGGYLLFHLLNGRRR